MSSGCIFCGRTPVTREHLWPDWLQRDLEIREPFEIRIEQEHDGVETRDIRFEAPPFNQTVRAVCAECNNGWMSEMEAAAKPILWPLIHAEGRRLDAAEQRVLARWALLKACVFDELHPGEGVVLPAHREYLYEHRDPPPHGFWVTLATYEAEELRHYAHQGLRLSRGDAPAPPGPNVYFVTITAGALVVHVTGSGLSDLPVGIPLPFRDELGVIGIWPPTASVDFDQLRVMKHETLVGFTTMLYNVVGRLAGGAPPAR
jgi:hypothetical protein